MPGPKLDASQAGRALVAADVAIGVGWGGTATFTVAAPSNDARGRIRVTASATTPAQATSTVTVTFAKAKAVIPTVVVSRDQDGETTNAEAVTNGIAVQSTSKTGFVLISTVIPVASKVTCMTYLVVE
jgi:hypothetical protein